MAIKDAKTKKSTTAMGGAQKVPKAAKAKTASKPKEKPARPAGGPALQADSLAVRVEPAPARRGKEESKVVLRIRVRAYESKILDASVKQIIDTARRYDAEIVGPVPLPTEIKKYTVNRASFIYKNTREQFEIRVHKRLIDIVNPNQKTIEALTNLSLPSGVDIDVKML